MRRDVGISFRKVVSISAVILGLSSQALGDYSELVELAQNSDLACGNKVRKSDVLLIDLEAKLEDKAEAVAIVHKEVPEHGLQSPVPLLIEKAHTNGKMIRRSALLRDAVREAASRGCDLVIVLDVDVFEKLMFRPQLMELKLPVSYVLVLMGSQVRNSASVSGSGVNKATGSSAVPGR